METPEAVQLPDLPPGEDIGRQVEVRSALALESGRVRLTAGVREAREYDSPPRALVIHTREYVPPRLLLKFHTEDDLVSGGTASGRLDLSNTGAGTAYGIEIQVHPRTPGVDVRPERLNLRALKSGEEEGVSVQIRLARSFDRDKVTLEVSARDARGDHSASGTFTLDATPALPLLELTAEWYRADTRQTPACGDDTHILLTCGNSGRASARGVRARLRLPELNWERADVGFGIVDPSGRQPLTIRGPRIPRNFREQHVRLYVTLAQDDFEDLLFSDMLPVTVTRPDLAIVFPPQEVRKTQLESVSFVVENRGSQAATGVTATLLVETPGIELRSRPVEIGRLDVGAGKQCSFQLSAKRTAPLGPVSGRIVVSHEGFEPLQEPLRQLSVAEVPTEVVVVEPPSAGPGPVILRADSPPLVAIGTPAQARLRTTAGTLEISGEARDDHQVVDVRPEVNGEMIGTRGVSKIGRLRRTQTGEARRSFRFELPLEIGTNRIVITAVDDQNATGSAERLVERVKPGGRAWAVIVGISDYRVPSLRLQAAAGDAKRFAEFLAEHSGLPGEQIRLLVDGQATDRNIRSALGTWCARSARDDLVIIYLAGHGTRAAGEDEGYFLPVNADLDDLPGSAVSIAEIQRLLRWLRGRRRPLDSLLAAVGKRDRESVEKLLWEHAGSNVSLHQEEGQRGFSVVQGDGVAVRVFSFEHVRC